ncbi:hypothetical protein GCM10023107_43840 [Actinoplanes octamycinicus]|nr:hypothetical protein Aoc01nite_42670 [Actinoplanes octamycinicus]
MPSWRKHRQENRKGTQMTTRQESRKISATAHPDPQDPRRVAYWLVTDDVRIGAARNGIQVAEELHDRGTL